MRFLLEGVLKACRKALRREADVIAAGVSCDGLAVGSF